MVILSKLSLIIPTYNRQNLALRNMRYWSGSGVSVYIFDGSELPIGDDELNGLASNIHYHHLPVSLYERLRYAQRFVKTEFCALLADDDFFLPSGLEKAIQHLERNPDLVSCGGQAVGFFSSDRSVLAKSVYPDFFGYSINQCDPPSRMAAHMATYTPSSIYSVTHSEVWKRAMRIMLCREFPVFAIGELQFELAIAFFGKSEMHDSIHWLRCFDNEPIRGTDISLDPANRFDEFWDLPDRRYEKNEFLDHMANEFIKLVGGNLNTVRSSIEDAFDAYRGFIQKRKVKREALRASGSLTIWQRVVGKFNSFRRTLNLGNKSVEFTLKEIVQSYDPAVTKDVLMDIDEIVNHIMVDPSNEKAFPPARPRPNL